MSQLSIDSGRLQEMEVSVRKIEIFTNKVNTIDQQMK
jgi:coenzyme F420-reducing hydrogenase delta subunit